MMGYFGVEHDRLKQPLALRIIEWVFSDRGRQPDRGLCCDVCDGGRFNTKGSGQFICQALGLKPSPVPSYARRFEL
jgi:hypothetical protein